MATKQTRGEFLLKAAAAAFEQGIDPFSTAWLSEHEVTAQECFDLGQSLSTVIKAYLASDADFKIKSVLESR